MQQAKQPFNSANDVYEISLQLEHALALIDTITDLTDDMAAGRFVDPQASARRLGALGRLCRDYLSGTLQQALAVEGALSGAKVA